MRQFACLLVVLALFGPMATPAHSATVLNQGDKTTQPAPVKKEKKAKAEKPAKKEAQWSYLTRETVPPTILPPPYAQGSQEWNKDLAAILKAQSKLTDKIIKAIKHEANTRPSLLTSVMGRGYSKKKFPKLVALLEKTHDDAWLICVDSKKHWQAIRPYDASDKVKLVIAPLPPDNYAYPSGHALMATLWAEILAELKPELADKFRSRANSIAQHRVQAGLHYPNDLAAGRQMAWAILRELKKSEKYQADFAAAKAELAAAPAAKTDKH